MTTVAQVRSRQILDSRGRPTVEAEVHLENGLTARASVPSGASTGKAEAVELRDGGSAWEGRGVTRAVAHVADEISRVLVGADVTNQTEIDELMLAADGTADLSRLGANAVLSVSLAVCRAAAIATGQPLFARLAELGDTKPAMPMPMVNILSGGLHAGHGMDVQDFLVVPVGASSYTEALDWVSQVRSQAAVICADQGLSTLLADEGGLSPGFATPEQALDLMVTAFEATGLRPGEDLAIALDMASSGLFTAEGAYHFSRQGRTISPSDMIELQAGWIERYPIISIEDGLDENAWPDWQTMTARLGGIQLVGDDLFATQPDRIRRGVESGCANAALIKVNQNGTLTGTMKAIDIARRGGYATVVSARSGETEDDFLADLAVGVAGGQIKIGSVRNSERLAKYNQLLRLEEHGLPWSGVAGLALR